MYFVIQSIPSLHAGGSRLRVSTIPALSVRMTLLVRQAKRACGPHRTSTFPGRRKVDFYRFFVKTRLKCLLKSVFQCPLSAAGVVAGALVSFVFHLFAELESF
jgi:hypothetical protein